MSFSKVESCFLYCSITENEYTEEWMKKVYSDPKTRRDWIETILVKCQRIQFYCDLTPVSIFLWTRSEQECGHLLIFLPAVDKDVI